MIEMFTTLILIAVSAFVGTEIGEQELARHICSHGATVIELDGKYKAFTCYEVNLTNEK